MKNLVVCFVAWALLPAGSASADRLVTGTLWADAPVYFACNLTNVGEKTRSVRTQLVNGFTGEVLAVDEAELAPRRTLNTTIPGLEGGGPLYCDFDFKGKKKHFRGVAKLWAGPGVANSSDLTAIPAQ